MRVFALDAQNRYGHRHSGPIEENSFSHPEAATETRNTEQEEEKEGRGRDRRRRRRSRKKGRGQTTGSSLHSFEFRIQIGSNIVLESTIVFSLLTQGICFDSLVEMLFRSKQPYKPILAHPTPLSCDAGRMHCEQKRPLTLTPPPPHHPFHTPSLSCDVFISSLTQDICFDSLN